MDKKKINDALDLGTWLGRKQAFGMLAGKCSAVDAECLTKIWEEKKYKALGMRWEDFCQKRLGISRRAVEKIVRLRKEFGPQFFELAAVVRITPEEYRRIAPSVTAEGIHHRGRLLEISLQNAPALSDAIEELRQQAAPAPPAAVDDLEQTLDRARRALRAGFDGFRKAGRMGPAGPQKLRVLQEIRRATEEVSRFGLEEVASGKIFSA